MYKNEPPLKNEDAADKRLPGMSVLKYTGGKMSCIRILYLQYNIKLAFKDGKARFEAGDFSYNHYNQMSLQKSQLYGFSDKGSCGSSNTLEELMKCDHCDKEMAEFFAYVGRNVEAQIASLKEALQAGARTEENW